MAHMHESRRNGVARGALKSRAYDVLEDFEDLRKDISKLADAARRAAQSEVEHTTENFERLGRDVRNRAERGKRYVNEQVRDHPATLIGVTLGLGLLLGLVMKPRWRR